MKAEDTARFAEQLMQYKNDLIDYGELGTRYHVRKAKAIGYKVSLTG